jgi:hypothetical protein
MMEPRSVAWIPGPLISGATRRTDRKTNMPTNGQHCQDTTKSDNDLYATWNHGFAAAFEFVTIQAPAGSQTCPSNSRRSPPRMSASCLRIVET